MLIEQAIVKAQTITIIPYILEGGKLRGLKRAQSPLARAQRTSAVCAPPLRANFQQGGPSAHPIRVGFRTSSARHAPPTKSPTTPHKPGCAHLRQRHHTARHTPPPAKSTVQAARSHTLGA